jgi:hypothetical protein
MKRLMISKSGTWRLQVLREPTATWIDALTSSDYDTEGIKAKSLAIFLKILGVNIRRSPSMKK